MSVHQTDETNFMLSIDRLSLGQCENSLPATVLENEEMVF